MAARALAAGAVFFGGRRVGAAAGRRAGAMATATGAQVEAALNRKDVEVLELNPHDEEKVAIVGGGGGTPDAGEWVPDGETGVFVPADAGTDMATPAAAAPVNGGGSSPSVLDQAVFVREEEMEDVERPAIDIIANANGGGSSN